MIFKKMRSIAWTIKKECVACVEQMMFESRLAFWLEFRVPAHIKGCRYMKYAILMAIEDCNRINYITKLLYPEIAKKCKTTTSSVERAIRHAIDIVWIKGNQELLKRNFGKFVMEGQERPTNSQFIAAVADWMRLEHQIKVS